MSEIKEQVREIALDSLRSNKEKAGDLHKLIKEKDLENKFAGIFLTILNLLDPQGDNVTKELKALKQLVTKSDIGWANESDTDLTAILRVVKDTDGIELSGSEEQGLNRLIGLAEEVRRKTEGSS